MASFVGSAKFPLFIKLFDLVYFHHRSRAVFLSLSKTASSAMVNKFHISYSSNRTFGTNLSITYSSSGFIYRMTPNPKITLADCVILHVNTLIQKVSILDKFLSSCRVCVKLNTRFTAISCGLSGPKRTHPTLV